MRHTSQILQQISTVNGALSTPSFVMDSELEERTKVTQEYLDSLYKMSDYELREEVHDLYMHCFMLSDCLQEAKKVINNVIAELQQWIDKYVK